MKRQYNGLEAVKIQLENNDVIANSNCVAMIQLLMENGVCVSPSYQQQIEYVGENG